MNLVLWREYLGQLDRLGGILEQLTELEREKTAAVGRNDLDAVDACMKREQVFSLNLRGFDQKREKTLAKLGLTGSTLRQLEQQAPPEIALEAKRTAEKLRQRYQVFQSASEVARNALECNLHAIEKIQKEKDARNETPPKVRQADFRA